MHPARLSALSAAHFALRALPRFIAPIERSDFWAGIGQLSLPPSSLPLITDPSRSPWVRTLDVPPPPSPLPLRPRLDFGRRVRRHAHPVGPACLGLHLRSVLQRASGFFPTRPRGARPDCLATPHLRAVAFGLRLLPTCSAEDLHLQSRVHAWHTKPCKGWPSAPAFGG